MLSRALRLSALAGVALAMWPATPAGAAGAETIAIARYAYGPSTLAITVGDSVTWRNDDAVGHDVTTLDGGWASPPMPHGAVFSHTFAAPGTVAYFCSVHPDMRGTVVVLRAPVAVATPAVPRPVALPVPAPAHRGVAHVVALPAAASSQPASSPPRGRPASPLLRLALATFAATAVGVVAVGRVPRPV